MSIAHVENVNHLNKLLGVDPVNQEAQDKLTVIDFHATWCGPCHQIAPRYESLSTSHPKVQFLKCDVDAVEDVTKKYSISAMPTFLFFKGGKQVDMVRGADQKALGAAVEKYAPKVNDPAPGPSDKAQEEGNNA